MKLALIISLLLAAICFFGAMYGDDKRNYDSGRFMLIIPAILFAGITIGIVLIAAAKSIWSFL